MMVKIGDLEVLAKLIKEYGEGGQTIAVQLRAAEILASMRQEDFVRHYPTGIQPKGP